jgi:hypothetical protein
VISQFLLAIKFSWATLAFCGLTALANWWTPPAVSLWALFCLPIFTMTWNRGALAGSILAAVCFSYLIVACLFFPPPSWSAATVSLISRLFVFSILVWLTSRLRIQQVSRVFIPGDSDVKIPQSAPDRNAKS